MALQFTRNAEVYVALRNASTDDHVQSWKMSVLDGFSFTQSINSSEITINEAGSTSRRARLLFNDSLAPVEWSMSTYARPFDGTDSPAKCNAPEEALWGMFVGADTWDLSAKEFKKGASAVNAHAEAALAGDSTNTFNFNQSNVSSMPDNWDLWFAFEDGTNKQYYKLESAVVNSVTMDFDIDGIATLQWSGFAKALSDEGITQPDQLKASPSVGDALIADGLTTSDNFIRNRISTLDLVRTDKLIGSPGTEADGGESYVITSGNYTWNDVPDPGPDTITVSGSDVTGDIAPGDIVSGTGVTAGTTVASISYSNPDTTITLSNFDGSGSGDLSFYTPNRDVYNIVLTGGSISMENNITYLTPEELGVVNAPLANITGARSISGSLTCYLDNDATTSKSGELFADLVSDTDTIRNVFDMSINIGGVTTNTPRVVFDLPTAHLEVPVVNVEDLLTLEVAFHGQVANGNVDSTNEATIIYKA